MSSVNALILVETEEYPANAVTLHIQTTLRGNIKDLVLLSYLMMLFSKTVASIISPRKSVCNCTSSTLKRFFMRPGFEELCESWRDRQLPHGVMADVYDGTVWSDSRR